MTVARPPEYRPFRIALYVLYGVVVTLLCGLLLRGVIADLYLRPLKAGIEPRPPARVCVEDLDRLYRQLAARLGGAPALPLGNAEAAQRELDAWERAWDDDVNAFGARCTGTSAAIDVALERIEDLRRHLARCGDEGRDGDAEVRLSLELARREVAAN